MSSFLPLSNEYVSNGHYIAAHPLVYEYAYRGLRGVDYGVGIWKGRVCFQAL